MKAIIFTTLLTLSHANPNNGDSSYTNILNNLPDITDSDLQSSMEFAETSGRLNSNPMRFQEANLAEDPSTETTETDTDTDATTQPMSTDEMNRLRASGSSDTEVAVEQAKRKIVQNKMETATQAMASEENQETQEAEEKQSQTNQEDTEIKDEKAERMDNAIENAALNEKASMEQDEQKENAKKEILESVKVEAEQEAEIEAGKLASSGMSPEDIINADKSDRQAQYLASMSPGAISAAELELSSVFSSVIGSK